VGVWRAAKPPATPPLFRPLLLRLRGRRGLGDKRVSTYGRSVSTLCTISKVPFATWQERLNSYQSYILRTYVSLARIKRRRMGLLG